MNRHDDAGHDRPEKIFIIDSNERILQFFQYDHLPPALREVSQPFGDLALRIVQTIKDSPQRAYCLRRLLEAKDGAVRAMLFK